MCIDPETLVLTSKGTISAKELGNLTRIHFIIHDDDDVLKVYRNEWVAPIISTSDHIFYKFSPSVKDGELQVAQVKADGLQVGDLVFSWRC